MNKKTGIWISQELISNPELDWEDKVMLSEIQSLHKLEMGCIISNEALGKFINIHAGNVSKRLSRLKSLGYIHIILKKKDTKKTLRTIIPTHKGMSEESKSTKRIRTKDYATTHEGVSVNAQTTKRKRSTTNTPTNSITNSITNSVTNTSISTEELLDKYLEKFNIK